MLNQDSITQISEPVIWVFSTQHKFSLFKMMTCNIVFMQDKVILAYLTSEMQKAESKKVKEDIKATGKGFFKGSMTMINYWSTYNEKYYSMTSEAILAEEESNLLIPYTTIKNILFKCESKSIDSDGTSTGSQGKLHFDLSNGETLKFTHSQTHDKFIRETLDNIFGEKLKYKKGTIF